LKKAYTISQKSRIAMLSFYFLLFLLVVRLFFLQFVQGSDLKEQMYNQLITSRSISPKRGTIYDSTGTALAISAQVDTVSINPSLIIVKDDEEKTIKLKEKVAKAFSEIFSLDYDETFSKVSSDTTFVYIARKVEKDKIDKLKEWMEKEEIYSGINIDGDTKRYYPYENLASSLIGFCNNDNQGSERFRVILE